MLTSPDRTKGSDLVDRAVRVFQKGSPAASWVFGSFLLLTLVTIFFVVPNPTDFQRGLARFFLALTSGLFAFFFVGGVVLSGGWKGITIGAAGGFALFVALQFWFDPFPGTPSNRESELKEWKGGQRLGSLIATLQGKALTGEIDERVIVDPKQKAEIENLKVVFDRVTGKTWADVFERVCGTLHCLGCEIAADRKMIRLSLRGAVRKENSLYVCR